MSGIAVASERRTVRPARAFNKTRVCSPKRTGGKGTTHTPAAFPSWGWLRVGTRTSIIADAGAPLQNVFGEFTPGSQEVTPALVRRQPRHDLRYRVISPLLNLFRRLILNRVWDIYGIEVRPPESRGLGSRRRPKGMRGNWNGRNSHRLKSRRIVQTARGARPSIGQRLDRCVHLRIADLR